MKLLALTFACAASMLLFGCGGMPKPQIEAAKPRADATLVRVNITATNYDTSWDKENVRLRCSQIWLNDSGVPTNKEQVFDVAFNGRAGDARSTLKMKDSEGRSTNRVRLNFELVSGENKATENVSAGTTLEWKVPSGLEQKDIVFLAVVSRKARSNYAIDVLYAMDPVTAELVQVLPSYDAE
jgi:hypothetical protein